MIWKKSFTDYPATAWTLKYALVMSGQRYEIIAVADGTKQYSLFRTLRAMAFRDRPEFQAQAAFEREVSDVAEKKLGVTGKVFIMPYDVYASREVPHIQKRVLSAGTSTDGAELVADNLLAGNFIDVSRNLSVSLGLGAQTPTGLVGDIKIPRKTSGSAAAWIATEGGDASVSELQFDQVALTPKILGAYAEITRNILLQSSPGVENLVREDLAGNLAYVMEPATRGSLKTTPKESG